MGGGVFVLHEQYTGFRPMNKKNYIVFKKIKKIEIIENILTTLFLSNSNSEDAKTLKYVGRSRINLINKDSFIHKVYINKSKIIEKKKKELD